MEETIVLYPSAARGHLVTMVELGKLIIKHLPQDSDLMITIILYTLAFESPGSMDSYISSASTTTPSIKFIHLSSDGEENGKVAPHPVAASSSLDIGALSFEVPKQNNLVFKKALVELSQTRSIKAVVLDFFCNAAFKVSSNELKIPTYYYLTSGACGVAMFLYYPVIDKSTGLLSLKDVDFEIKVPGVASVPSKDMPASLADKSHRVYSYFLDISYNLPKSSGLIVNTFEALEDETVKAIVEGKCLSTSTDDNDHNALTTPPLYCVGPLIGSNGSEEDIDCCLTWLDSQLSKNVVFLSFGSVGVFSASQLNEIATALERSGVRFLWVVRNPPSEGVEAGSDLNLKEPKRLEDILPQGFMERTKDRGLVVKMWAPQVSVLNHDSVGGFVTHCGWNSVLESVAAGVPMLTWPLYAEQKMNRAFVVEGMKVALPIKEEADGFVSSGELESRLNELMNSETGKAVRDRVTAMKEAAKVAVSDGGSSFVALHKLLDSFIKAPEATRKLNGVHKIE